MQDHASASGTAPRARATDARLARLLPVLAALLLCALRAGPAPAQEREQDGDAGVRRPVVNVKPFEDVALHGMRLVEQGKLGPDTTLDVSATAERGADGGLRPESVQVQWHAPADETVSELTRRLLTAFSESRVLSTLEGVKAVRLALKLDRQNVSVQVACEMPSELEAERYAEGHRMLVMIGTVSKRGTDEGELYERLGFSSEGKMFKMSFEMPRDEATRMIGEMLAKSAAKRD